MQDSQSPGSRQKRMKQSNDKDTSGVHQESGESEEMNFTTQVDHPSNHKKVTGNFGGPNDFED